MIALAIILAVLVLIALLPVGGRVVYSAGGVQASLLAGPIRIRLFPRTKKPKPKKAKAKKKPKKVKKAAEPKEKTPETAPKGGKFQMLWQFVQLGVSFLGSLRRKLLIRDLTLSVTYGGSDPAKTAINYGRSVGAAHALLPLMEQVFRIRRQDVRVLYDAQSEEMAVYLNAAITIRVGQVLALAVRYGVRALRIFLSSKQTKNVEKAVSK